jgi:hypothetical protein
MLSEQYPLDSATFSYSYPLLHQVLLKGGVGLTEEDDPLEQVALTLDIIKFHCGECLFPGLHIKRVALTITVVTDFSFPRLQIARGVIHATQHQLKLSKEASSVLIEFGQTISSTATIEEIEVFLKSLLIQEAHVRNASLQTLQVNRND